jgi:hypothetical protein
MTEEVRCIQSRHLLRGVLLRSAVLCSALLCCGGYVMRWQVVSYGINVFVCMALVKEMSAVFCVVFGATVLPTTTVAFSIAGLTVRAAQHGMA